ncbi:Prefoldin alpha subunit [Cylindrobasidium torrendii FP15055 ss-10]|uniref:Prefoldin alpha subunit n=1 Tax=Cylindrobasidium torrendii FP15055 ss-10 TaxID=1314674 RepID=A0A0D7BBC1_9AGAR|nr:Prefoldin alpha subunit [Cylindrobasidium torrendii FP15055 ss-10]
MSEAQQQVNVGDLSLQQLSEVRKQLEEELGHLTTSFAQLKAAQVKFKSCIENVQELKRPSAKGNSILVPLTNSLYVPGKIRTSNSVLVDVGTGYYVEKSLSDASNHYSNKVEFLNGNLAKLDETISKKRENMSMLLNVMQSKLAAQTGTEGKAED